MQNKPNGIALLMPVTLICLIMSISSSASAQQSGTIDLTVTRSFDAPVGKLWKAWSESDYVKKWWQPDGFTTPVANMDFKEGGKSLLCMRSPDGHDMYNTWTYSRIVPNERIEFVLNFSDKDGNKLDPAKIGMPPGLPADVRHVITFKSVGDNKTEVTVKEYGYGSVEIVEMSKAGLEQCLNKMATAVQ
jgi:uncharacterized protein YndB with AHSA1/START domain